MIKSILVVLGGFGAMTVATMVLFVVLGRIWPGHFSPQAVSQPAGGPPPTGMIVVVLAGGLLAAIGGGWLTGRLASGAVWSHVWGLAGLVVVMSLVTALAESQHPGPTWYRLTLPVVGVLGVLLGGRLA